MGLSCEVCKDQFDKIKVKSDPLIIHQLMKILVVFSIRKIDVMISHLFFENILNVHEQVA